MTLKVPEAFLAETVGRFCEEVLNKVPCVCCWGITFIELRVDNIESVFEEREEN